MSYEAKIHEAQTKILRELLFMPAARFAHLQKLTGLEPDHAKFHIKRLVELEYIEKSGTEYRLSIVGKEYANKLDTVKNTIERQPKSTTIMILYNKKTDKYLIQKRLKQPYYGFLAFYSGKITWGESIYETAVRETKEETGLLTKLEDWEWRGVYHERVRHMTTGEMIEDKLFYIMYCEEFTGEMIKEFEGGVNAWMRLEEVRKNPRHFKSLEIEIKAAKKFIGLMEAIDEYSEEEF